MVVSPINAAIPLAIVLVTSTRGPRVPRKFDQQKSTREPRVPTKQTIIYFPFRASLLPFPGSPRCACDCKRCKGRARRHFHYNGKPTRVALLTKQRSLKPGKMDRDSPSPRNGIRSGKKVAPEIRATKVPTSCPSDACPPFLGHATALFGWHRICGGCDVRANPVCVSHTTS